MYHKPTTIQVGLNTPFVSWIHNGKETLHIQAPESQQRGPNGKCFSPARVPELGTSGGTWGLGLGQSFGFESSHAVDGSEISNNLGCTKLGK